LTCLEIWSVLKDLTLLGAAVTAAVVAVKGLGTWQQQLKGQAEYDLSRRILVSLFKYRDAINNARHPAMWVNEMPSPPVKEAEKMKGEDFWHYGLSNGYQNRWDKVQEQKSSLNADLLEAEAIWGNRLPEMFKAVYALDHELYRKICNYLEMKRPRADSVTKDAFEKNYSNSRDIMYRTSNEEPDEFKQDLLNAIDPIKRYLKSKIGHKEGITNRASGAASPAAPS
jgi:hypothetical protein